MSYKDEHLSFERLGIKHKIAITGLSRTGKSTAADFLSEVYGFYVYDMSDDLKLDYHDDIVKRGEYTGPFREGKPREGYQMYGQLQRYAKGDDHWIDKVQKRITMDHSAIEMRRDESGNVALRNNPHHKVLLTGLRQPNEFEYARANGFTIIRLEVDEDIRIERIKASGEVLSDKTKNHETELTLMDEKVDFVVKNNTNDPENMIDWIDEIAREVIMGGRF